MCLKAARIRHNTLFNFCMTEGELILTLFQLLYVLDTQNECIYLITPNKEFNSEAKLMSVIKTTL